MKYCILLMIVVSASALAENFIIGYLISQKITSKNNNIEYECVYLVGLDHKTITQQDMCEQERKFQF